MHNRSEVNVVSWKEHFPCVIFGEIRYSSQYLEAAWKAILHPPSFVEENYDVVPTPA